MLVACRFRLRGFFGIEASLQLPARRGPGLHVHAICSFPTPLRSNGPKLPRDRSKDPPGQDARRRVHHQRRRLQPAQLVAHQLQRILLRHLEGVGATAQSREEQYQGDHAATSTGSLRRSAAGNCVLASRRRPFPASAPPAASPSCSRTAREETCSFSPTNVDKFLAAARKRPEIGTSAPRSCPACRSSFIDVDRDKVIKQGVESTTSTGPSSPSWAARSSTTSTASAANGRSTSRPKATTAIERRKRRPVLRAEQQGRDGAALRADAVRVAHRPRIHHALQPVPLGADQWRRGAGL